MKRFFKRLLYAVYDTFYGYGSRSKERYQIEQQLRNMKKN